MTLLTIAAALAKNVGLSVPDVVISSPNRQWLEAAQFANETGEELARRVDWGKLQETATLTGDGTAKIHSLPSGFSRRRSALAAPRCLRHGLPASSR